MFCRGTFYITSKGVYFVQKYICDDRLKQCEMQREGRPVCARNQYADHGGSKGRCVWPRHAAGFACGSCCRGIWLAVAMPEEAAQLIENGIGCPILVLGKSNAAQKKWLCSLNCASDV